MTARQRPPTPRAGDKLLLGYTRGRLPLTDTYGYDASMHTVRMTLNVDEALLTEVLEAHPGVTKTELVQRGLRALLARESC